MQCPQKNRFPMSWRLSASGCGCRCCALPLKDAGKELIVAMAEPQNLTVLDELMF